MDEYRFDDRLVRKWDFLRLEEVLSAVSKGNTAWWILIRVSFFIQKRVKLRYSFQLSKGYKFYNKIYVILYEFFCGCFFLYCALNLMPTVSSAPFSIPSFARFEFLESDYRSIPFWVLTVNIKPRLVLLSLSFGIFSNPKWRFLYLSYFCQIINFRMIQSRLF